MVDSAAAAAGESGTEGGTDGDYDVVVIGAGPVGENVADRAVQGGLRAVVVESERVGGECSYWACIPSKVLLRSGEARRAALAVPGAREAVTGELDVAAVLQRRTSFVSDWDDAGQVEWLESAGIDLVRGHGRLDGERRVVVRAGDGSERLLRARHAVAVCTGTRAHIPDIPGLREAEPWTSREAVSASEVPASLAIIGGGAVACEMATAFSDLGSEVTMLVRDRLLGGYEPVAGELVGEALTQRGVRLRLGVQAARADREAGGVRIGCDDGSELRASELLVATGREPRTEGLGLASVGLGQDAGRDGGWLAVDETLRVRGAKDDPLDWLYAIGDVNHRALVTHQGKYQARAAGDGIAARAAGRPVDDARWGAHVATADHGAVPQVVFTNPQVASVGMTSEQGRAAGHRVVEVDLGGVSGAALHADGYRGHAVMVVDTERGLVRGATLVGPDVAEAIHAATVAIAGEVPVDRLWHAVPVFPTMSEVWLRLLESLGR